MSGSGVTPEAKTAAGGFPVSANGLWLRAMAETENYPEANRRWSALMAEHGLNRSEVANHIIGHRALAMHGKHDRCDECPCDHCGTIKDDPDGDHTCPCPYSDADCPNHVIFGRSSGVLGEQE